MTLQLATRMGVSLGIRLALLMLALLCLAFIIGAPGSDPIIPPY